MEKANALAGAALAISAAVGAATVVGVAERPAPEAGPAGTQLAAVEARLAALERRLASLEGPAPGAGSPELATVSPPGPSEGAAPGAEAPADGALVPAPLAADGPQPAAEPSAPHAAPAAAGAVTEQVLGQVDQRIDQAVDAKLAELERKRNKRPTLDTVAELLELDGYQRGVVEQEVREGQRQIRTLLEIPTADGTNLVDELVEVLAYGKAMRPETGALWGKWFARVTNETVPGTDRTYAAQAEQTKAGVREKFRGVMTEDQYAEFEAWAFDPTEVQEIEGSPWADLEARVAERAAALTEQAEGQPPQPR